MAMATHVTIDRTAEVPPGIYPLQYSSRLFRTRKDFYDNLKIAAERSVAAGKVIMPPDANEEEQYIYVQKISGAKRPSDVEELQDYFAKNEDGWYAWAYTLTGLRVPEKYVCKTYRIGEKVPVQIIVTDITPYISQIADPRFTYDNWKDIIDKVNHVKAELAVPYSRGHVIREMHSTLGIFTEVEKTTEHKEPYALHAWLREDLQLPKDPISGYYDLAVGRRRDWLLFMDMCLAVDADHLRWIAHSYSDDSFRPVVRDSGSEGLKIVSTANVDVEQIIHELSENLHAQFATDLRNLTLPELKKKYPQL